MVGGGGWRELPSSDEIPRIEGQESWIDGHKSGMSVRFGECFESRQSVEIDRGEKVGVFRQLEHR